MSPPLVSMTLWSRVMFNWKAVSSQWGKFGTLLPPRGASFTPLCGMFLQSPSASSNVANFTFLRNPLSELWVCEFWLLRWSTMVARAWPVCVEVIQDWLLAAPSQTSPPSCFYDTSILRYPFDLFQWKSMGRVAKVPKWLLGAWLDSFTMILRCWLVIWVKWAHPLVSMTLWSRVMFNWKAVSMCRTAHFMGRPTPLKVNGATLGRSCPPGVQLLPPFWGMVLQSLPASSSVVIHKFLRNSRSELRPAKVWPNALSWDFLGDYLPLGRTSYPRSLIKVIAHTIPD